MAKATKGAKKPTTTVRLYTDIHYRVDVYASKQKQKLQDVVASALEEYLKKRGA